MQLAGLGYELLLAHLLHDNGLGIRRVVDLHNAMAVDSSSSSSSCSKSACWSWL
jgi:hypothetical protein